MCISNFGYESIYQVAKRMERNYRRVHDDVKRLIELKLIEAREKVVNGKRTIIVGI
jgi:predicted transcriptional regulator